MKDKSRSCEIDIIRGIGILLVVVLHVGLPSIFWTNFFGAFHMAIFIFCSGFCFKEISLSDKPSKYLIKKIKALYLPYVLFNGLMILLNNFFVSLNIYTDNEAFLNADIGIANFWGVE